jgi:membrane protein YdbS with pleckstrin-like domain
MWHIDISRPPMARAFFVEKITIIVASSNHVTAYAVRWPLPIPDTQA